MTMELSNSEKMAWADRTAIEERGIGSTDLMETAAVALADAAEALAGENRSAAVFCGPGNNGGDGVAAARLLLGRGFAVRAFLVGRREKMTGDARAMEERLLSAGGALEDFAPGEEEIFAWVKQAGVVIDALFGVGLSRPLAGDALAAVELINGARRPVAAADIPSGVRADTGAVLGGAVRADVTVTFSMAKPGHFVEPGCVLTGRLQVADIGIPADLLAQAGSGIYAIHGEDLALPRRKRLTHKGDHGKLLVLAGSVGYTGAAALCAAAAVRAGAGLVYLGVPADIYEIEAAKTCEAMAFPLRCNDRGRISRKALDVIRERLGACDVTVLGPGLGRDRDTEAVTAEVLRRVRGPVVLDADALWAVGRDLSLLDQCSAPVVLTPHEGEFMRLLGRPVEDRLLDALSFSRTYDCAVVLKGHRTVCAFPDGKAYIIDAGNPGMASGGTGDVLAGVIGALLGQLKSRRAVVTACWLHARAGDIAAGQVGQYALRAGDIIDWLPAAEMEITR